MSLPKGKLLIHPKFAELKSDRTHFFKADPYCVFRFGSQRKATATCKGGGNEPKWDDVLSFDRTDEEMLIIQVYDREILGEGYCNIVEIINSGAKVAEVEICRKGEFNGSICFVIEFEPSAKHECLSTEFVPIEHVIYAGDRF